MSGATTTGQTPSQTVGPYFAYGLLPTQYGYDHTTVVDNNMVATSTEGERLAIRGQVFDGAGDPVIDAMIELWQPNHHGRFNHPDDIRSELKLDEHFSGFGRCGTNEHGEFDFRTIKPGVVNAGLAPCINVIVMMRGMLLHAYTRIYFDDHAEQNSVDPVLSLVPEDRRQTLVATREDTPDGRAYTFNIHMQGNDETVFFDV